MTDSTTNLCPVVCFTCGRVVAHRWNDWVRWCVEHGRGEKATSAFLDEAGYDRYCCRRMFLSHTEHILDTSRCQFVQLRKSNGGAKSTRSNENGKGVRSKTESVKK